MNYIKHLTGFFEKVATDFELNPTHISLYMAIFQLWNQSRFQNPIGISRDELMRISKISSTATYHKCMSELATKEYVIYMPSHNPFKGSMLEVINLDYYTKPIQKREIKNRLNKQKNEQVIEQAIAQANDQAVNNCQTSAKHLPYINNTNNINIVNGQAQKNQIQNCHPQLVEGSLPQKKLREKKEITIPPTWETALAYFKEEKWPLIEAEKFYNHFESNGWLVGGKSKMKDWKAAARNWQLNSAKFRVTTTKPQPNHLQTLNYKNYAEPL